MPLSSKTTGAHRALAVLTNPVLLTTIVSLQNGVPVALSSLMLEHNVKDTTTPWPSLLVRVLAEHGTPQLVQLALTAAWYDGPRRGRPMELQSLDLQDFGCCTIEFNRVDLVQWLFETEAGWDCFNDETNLKLAVSHYVPGDTRMLDLLAVHDLLGDYDQPPPVDSVPDMTLLRWLEENVPDIVLSPKVMDTAAGRGDLEMVRYLHEHRTEGCTDAAAEAAFAARHDDVFWFLVENRPNLSMCESVMTGAAMDGDVALLRDLHRAWGRLDREAMTLAAVHGKVNVVRFLHGELDMPIHRDDVVGAIDSGRVGVLEYMYDHKVLQNIALPCNVIDYAARRGYLSLIKFLHSKSLGTCTHEAMDRAAERGDLAMVTFLHEHRTEGCTVEAMNKAAANGHLHVVTYLHQHRTEGCTTNAMNGAAERNLDIVRFLHENRTEGCTNRAMDHAATLDVLRFLLENRREQCTVVAIHRLALHDLESDRVAGMELLFRHRPRLFAVEALSSVLEFGCLDIWLTLCTKFGRDNRKDGAREAIGFAVRTYQLCTIRFLLCDHQRVDLVEPVLVTAASMPLGWFMMLVHVVREVMPTAECVQQAAVKNVLAAKTKVDAFVHEFRMSRRGKMDGTPLKPEKHSFRLLRHLPNWQLPNDARMDVLNPLAHEPDLPSWVYHELFAPCSMLHRWDTYGQGTPDRPTWMKSAIIHEDLAFLQRLLVLAKDNSYGDPRFSFEGARAVAICRGQLRTLQWLLSEIPEVPVEAGLLALARTHQKAEIAEWLVENCREGCVTSSSLRVETHFYIPCRCFCYSSSDREMWQFWLYEWPCTPPLPRKLVHY